jgi:hypothetical protein
VVAEKEHKLDMFGRVLPALDKRSKDFYDSLTVEEKKAYAPLVLMRAMSSLGDQNKQAAYQLLMVNDLVNIGFWSLSKHHELQHLLLCATGLGSKQYHPWLAAKSKAKTNRIDQFLMELNPGCNQQELAILKSQHDAKSIKRLAQDAGKSDAEVKQLVEDAKKLS